MKNLDVFIGIDWGGGKQAGRGDLAGLRMLCGSGKTIPDNIAHPSMLDKSRAQREGWIFGVGDQS